VESLTNSFRQEEIPYTLTEWLSRKNPDAYVPEDALKPEAWFAGPTISTSSAQHDQYGREADEGSIASVDDSLSVSDSAYDSSTSSAQSGWTSSATELTDIFLDDEDREPLRPSRKVPCTPIVSHHSTELQEQSVTSLSAKKCTNGGLVYDHSSAARIESHLHPLDRSGASTVRSERCPVKGAQESTTGPPVGTSTWKCGQGCNSRRSGYQGRTSSPPCKLKRDTDSTDCFVALLISKYSAPVVAERELNATIVFSTRLITAIWPLSACPPMMSTCFNGAGVLPLRVFIQETLRRSKTSYSTLQVALYYLILLKDKLPQGDFTKEQPPPPPPKSDQGLSSNGASPERSACRAMQCGRRMFLAALMLASKYIQDRNYSTRAWSKISGLRSAEINENEREYLMAINYDLHIPKESFENWSKIVLTLSKLSKTRPQCRTPPSCPDRRGPGIGSSQLHDMVAEASDVPSNDQLIFSDQWWTDLIRRIDPAIVMDSAKTEEYLLTNLPFDGLSQMLPHLNHTSQISSDAPESMTPAQGPDMNFSDTLKSRSAEQPRGQALPVPPSLGASPAYTKTLPLRPQPRNLPTPQSTPRTGEGCPWPIKSDNNTARSLLRCSASLDALRNMRKQCFINASLERCPPPRPHTFNLPSVRSLMRPAETNQDFPSRSTTPLDSSPMSVASDVTSSCTATTTTSRSRSSSISSTSSWSSWSSGLLRSSRLNVGPPHSSSPLSQISSHRDGPAARTEQHDTTTSAVSGVPMAPSHPPGPSISKFHDEGYGSGEDPPAEMARRRMRSISEVDAIQALLKMYSTSERTSQSTQQPPMVLLPPPSDSGNQILRHEAPRGHKRTLSRATGNLQTYVSESLRLDQVVADVIDDDHVSADGLVAPKPKQWQVPTKSWAAPRRPLPNLADNKRMATYCSIQQYASAPELAAQYLKDQMVTA